MASSHRTDKDLTLPQSSAVASPPLSLKSRLEKGDTLYGIFIFSLSPTLAEIAGFAGYDFVVVDMEHGNGGILEAAHCLHALAATNTPAVIRIPECSATWAMKALDLGPQGIMFPHVEDAESARKAVSYCHFPPKGVLGTAHMFVRSSRYGLDEGFLTNFEKDLLIMCQVESEKGVKVIDEIARVDGVDCVQMGPRDLAASMGYLREPTNKKVQEALHGAEKVVLRGGAAYLSGVASPHDPAEQLARRGYHMVLAGTDVGLFRSSAVADVKKFRMNLVDDDE
ncbi:Phosphoenolpyruvate carboxylase family protein [Perilla frutescens var. hirtella]|uniref:Phosphoenolpyruvate carboxylase family protein n=1 Tax=Perilla frutescens var. hirtella TaxID=608512 RepID=A0AAD4JJJ2_PERFH|nr:Phosphoenolpyruvate carboxylase family protein [Perilla frutescens var. hirtella]